MAQFKVAGTVLLILLVQTMAWATTVCERSETSAQQQALLRDLVADVERMGLFPGPKAIDVANTTRAGVGGASLLDHWIAYQPLDVTVEKDAYVAAAQALRQKAVDVGSARYRDLAVLSLEMLTIIDGVDPKQLYQTFSGYWLGEEARGDWLVRAEAMRMASLVALYMGYNVHASSLQQRAMALMDQQGEGPSFSDEHRAMRYLLLATAVTTQGKCGSVQQPVSTIRQIIEDARYLGIPFPAPALLNNLSVSLSRAGLHEANLALVESWLSLLVREEDPALRIERFWMHLSAAQSHHELGHLVTASEQADAGLALFPDLRPYSDILYLIKGEAMADQGHGPAAIAMLSEAMQAQLSNRSQGLAKRIAMKLQHVDIAVKAGDMSVAQSLISDLRANEFSNLFELAQRESQLGNDLFEADLRQQDTARILAEAEASRNHIRFFAATATAGVLVLAIGLILMRLRLVQQRQHIAELASEAKTRHLLSTSHDLRTPLNAIIGCAQTMSMGLFGRLGSPKYEEYARMIETSGHQLLNLVNDLLDAARSESGVAALQETRFDLLVLQREVMDVLRPLAERSALQIEVSCSVPSVMVWADRARLFQVLSNLLGNAIKYNREGGWISVRLSADDAGGLSLSVRNSGEGLTPEEIDVALTMFGTVTNDDTLIEQQTGVGLAVVQALIKQHGGSFRLSSVKHEWTEAVISLPEYRVLNTHRGTVSGLAAE